MPDNNLEREYAIWVKRSGGEFFSDYYIHIMTHGDAFRLTPEENKAKRIKLRAEAIEFLKTKMQDRKEPCQHEQKQSNGS